MKKEKQIQEQKADFEIFHAELIEEKNLSVYVNREKDPDGNIISAYVGLEDESGQAITGYDMPVEF